PRRYRARLEAAAGTSHEERRAAGDPRVAIAIVGDGQVETAVPVQVGGRDRDGIPAGGIANLRIERPVTATVEDRDVGRAIVRNGQIVMAVLVEVGAHHPFRTLARPEYDGLRIGAVPAPQADRYVPDAARFAGVRVGDG